MQDTSGAAQSEAPSSGTQPVHESRVTVVLGGAARPILIHWSTAKLPGPYSPFDSYAVRSRDGWILIDPEQPDAAAETHLRGLIRTRPIATLLTNDGHERSAYAVRERWRVPVWGPKVDEHASDRGVGYDGQPDHLYQETTALPGGIRAIKVAGLWGGEHSLLWVTPNPDTSSLEGETRVIFTGDLLNGQVHPDLARPDHFRRGPELKFGSRPQYAERHPDRPALKASLDRLLAERPHLLCGAHAMPFQSGSEAAIRRLRDAL